VGAVLGQWKDNKPYAIYYVSRALDDAQTNYATIEKGFLAIESTLKKIPFVFDQFKGDQFYKSYCTEVSPEEVRL